MTSKEVERVLRKAGWIKVRQNGSHAIFRKEGKASCPVQVGNKDIPPGTLSKIKRITGVKF